MGQEMRREVARRDDELAREREELSFDAVDDMHQDVSPSLPPSPADCRLQFSLALALPVRPPCCSRTCLMPFFAQAGGLGDGSVRSLSKIENLELSLMQEKQTVAHIQEALREAKAQQLVQQQLTKVRKHNSFLEGMAGQLSVTAQKEVEEKRKWENEWNHKFVIFKQQHHELQQGLEKKQLGEMKRLQQDFQRRIQKLDDDVALMKTKGRAPSPRSLMKVQDENVEQVVLLFQQHSQERLHLTEKISKQEDLLMKSRSQSLQRLFIEAQTKSENLYRRFNPKQNLVFKPVHMIMDNSDRDRLYTAATEGMPVPPPAIVIKAPPSRTALHSSRASSRRLLSPRLEVSGEGGDLTFSADYFLPGDSDDEEYVSPRSTAPPSRMSRTVSFGERSQDTGGGRSRSAMHRSAVSTAELSVVHPTPDMHGGVVNHDQSFGDQAANRRQNTVQNKTRRPLYAGAHGRLDKDDGDGRLPMPGTEQTGWKTIDNKKEGKNATSHRGTNGGDIRPAFISQIVTTQYRDSSAKLSQGTVTQMGGGGESRLQKASGKAYKVPIEKLGLSMGRTLPNVQARTREEKDDRRRKSGHSMLDPLSPKSPDWGSVTVGTRSATKGHLGVPPRAGSVDQIQHKGHHAQPKMLQLPERSLEQPCLPVVHSKQEDPIVSEKFSQLETWVEEKIRQILYQGPPPALASTSGARPGSVQGGDRQLSSSQGRAMHTTTTTTTPHASSAGSNLGNTGGVLPSVGRTGSISTPTAQTGDGSIGKLLTRLKSTMASDESLAEPKDKRKARPPALMSDVQAMSGMRSENPKVRAADDAKGRALQLGQSVQQVYDDLEVQEGDRGEAWNVSAVAAERRGKFGRLDISSAHHAITPKTPKRVVFQEIVAHEASKFDDVFRPETGYSQQTMDRPETGASSAFGDPHSRPVTGVRAGNSDFTATSAEDEADDAEAEQHLDLDQLKKDFFPKVRHNQVGAVEDALAAGFPVDTRDEHGNTALHVSCQNGHKRLAKLCLKYGASPDTTNHQGNTALHYAISYGYQPLAKYLISHGSDDTVMNLQGQTPYEMNKK